MKIKVINKNSTYTFLGDCTEQLKEIMGNVVTKAYVELASAYSDNEYANIEKSSKEIFEKIISNYNKTKSFDIDSCFIVVVLKNKNVIKFSTSEWGTIMNSTIIED